jgi:hypothetical protein
MSSAADIAMVVLAMGMVLLLGVGAARSARLGGRDATSSKRLGVTVVLALCLWLLVTGLLASSGVLAVWTSRPPRWPLLPLTALVATVAYNRTALAKALVASTPRAWPIAAQTFRVAVELAIFALHEAGRAPRQITFEGRNFDILVGLTAPLIAWLVARRRISPTSVALWNVLGLAILANTMGTVATSTPGPLHLDWAGAPFTAVASWPVVWLPALLAPLAVFLHVLSLRQALTDRRAAALRSTT